MRHCPQCHCLFDDMDEHRALSHMERCLKSEPVGDDPRTDLSKILLGAAYFDEPQETPPSFEMILLWQVRSLNTFYSDAPLWPDVLRKGAEGLTKLGAYRDRYGWTALKRSKKEILGFKGRRANFSLDDLYSGALIMSRTNPKIYFCLLVEPTQVDGTYRRCGVALTYWINGAKGSRGLPLHLNCTEKMLALV